MLIDFEEYYPDIGKRFDLPNVYDNILREAEYLISEYSTLPMGVKTEEETLVVDCHQRTYRSAKALLSSDYPEDRVYYTMVSLAYHNVKRASEIKYGLFGPYGRVAPRPLASEFQAMVYDTCPIKGIDLIRCFAKIAWLRTNLSVKAIDEYYLSLMRQTEIGVRNVASGYKRLYRTNDINPEALISNGVNRWASIRNFNSINLLTLRMIELETYIKNSRRK